MRIFNYEQNLIKDIVDRYKDYIQNLTLRYRPDKKTITNISITIANIKIEGTINCKLRNRIKNKKLWTYSRLQKLSDNHEGDFKLCLNNIKPNLERNKLTIIFGKYQIILYFDKEITEIIRISDVCLHFKERKVIISNKTYTYSKIIMERR